MALAELTKPVRRKATTTGGYGPLTITIAPEGLYLKPYRGRKRFLLPWSAAFLRAATLEADRVRAERGTKKRGATRQKRGVLRRS